MIQGGFRRKGQRYTHGEMIMFLIQAHRSGFSSVPVFVETGCGISTLWLAESGKACNARIYSCDMNQEKVDVLRRLGGSALSGVEFVVGDSLDALRQIGKEHERIDFLFLDASASAMHTFQEFHLVEDMLQWGSVLLIDNAALPGEKHLLSPCRKGKIIVPYLQASPWWEVRGHPDTGDSMISALHRDRPDYADPDYEWPEYVDAWEWSFQHEWPQRFPKSVNDNE